MACVGDSGGPLIKTKDNNEADCLYGVISYASHNCIRGVTVFTRAPSYKALTVYNWFNNRYQRHSMIAQDSLLHINFWIFSVFVVPLPYVMLLPGYREHSS